MKLIYTFLFLFLSLQAFASEDNNNCQSRLGWASHACHRLHQIWEQGDTELYLTGYSWHNRFTYEHSKLSRYNEKAWGGGLGKGLYDEHGNWHALAAFAFLDSHKYLEPVVGYAFVKILHLNENTRLGGGYSILVTQRPDIFHGIPFPGVLPWITINYRKAALFATYIPGAQGAGNVLFLFAKWTF